VVIWSSRRDHRAEADDEGRHEDGGPQVEENRCHQCAAVGHGAANEIGHDGSANAPRPWQPAGVPREEAF
jgi:hypothetical protein